MKSVHTILWNKKTFVHVFQYVTHHQRLKVWDGLGDKNDLPFYRTFHPPAPVQLDFQFVDNLSMTPPEG